MFLLIYLYYVICYGLTAAGGYTHVEPGAAFGEVALLTDNGTRSASVIADRPTDLIVIDRDLYERCVQDVIRREFQQKADFVAGHPQFGRWAPKYRHQLAMALEKQAASFEQVVTRQGATVDAVYYVISSVRSVFHHHRHHHHHHHHHPHHHRHHPHHLLVLMF